MTQYEKTLSKIAPTFYKTLQYYYYFYENGDKVVSYLIYSKLPSFETYIKVKDIKNIKYVYFCLWYSKYMYPIYRNVNFNIMYENSVLLATKDKITETHDLSLDEFIVSMVLNRFSFENEHMLIVPFPSFAELFIALVGEDMYETIRNNIK